MGRENNWAKREKISELWEFKETPESTKIRRNPRKHAGVGEKNQPDEGLVFYIGGGNADLKQNSLPDRKNHNNMIISTEVILRDHLSPTRPEKRFSPPISRHRTRMTGLQ